MFRSELAFRQNIEDPTQFGQLPNHHELHSLKRQARMGEINLSEPTLQGLLPLSILVAAAGIEEAVNQQTTELQQQKQSSGKGQSSEVKSKHHKKHHKKSGHRETTREDLDRARRYHGSADDIHQIEKSMRLSSHQD